jgi:hypothetical protein
VREATLLHRFGMQTKVAPSVPKSVSQRLGTRQAYPSGWQPGKPTLKTGPRLVAKVWEVWKSDMAF